jgi:FixJ family two-component response regulator
VPKAKPLISIVDDDESMREAVKGLIKSWGYTAEAFASAEEFLSSRQVPRTACLIADVMMPGMTGLELHRHLVASGKTIPTILITAHPDDGVRERALQDGIIGYLSKPFSEDDLMACIRSSLTVLTAREKLFFPKSGLVIACRYRGFVDMFEKAGLSTPCRTKSR